MLHNWHNEAFFRTLNPLVSVDIVSDILEEYMRFRNITPSREQREYIIKFTVEELRSNAYAYAKPCLIRWALRKYDDPRNNNLSAGVIFEYIRLGYKSHEYQQIVHAYLEAQDNQVEEKSLSTRNLEAMEDAWAKCVASVKADKANLNDWFWASGYRYLALVLKYRPEQSIIDRCQEQAYKQTFDEWKRDANNMRLRGQHDDAKEMLRELENKNFANGDAVTNLRRKLVALDYISKNLSELTGALKQTATA